MYTPACKALPCITLHVESRLENAQAKGQWNLVSKSDDNNQVEIPFTWILLPERDVPACRQFTLDTIKQSPDVRVLQRTGWYCHIKFGDGPHEGEWQRGLQAVTGHSTDLLTPSIVVPLTESPKLIYSFTLDFPPCLWLSTFSHKILAPCCLFYFPGDCIIRRLELLQNLFPLPYLQDGVARGTAL